MTTLTSQPMMSPLMLVSPKLVPQMMVSPTVMLPRGRPWIIHLLSYPPRVICTFCFVDSHEIRNHKCKECWKKPNPSTWKAE